MISLLGGTAPYAPDVSFSKKFFEGCWPLDFGYKKAPRLGAPFTWLLSDFFHFGLEFLKDFVMRFNEVDNFFFVLYEP